MTWIEYHTRSEKCAADAHKELRSGNPTRSKALFAEAAELEQSALDVLDHSKTRTLGITAVSVASLHYKSGNLGAAEQTIHQSLSLRSMPEFARSELRTLLQIIWTELAQQETDLTFVPSKVLVSVRGGEVVTGGAPLSLIVEKVQSVQALFFRTAEFLGSLPFRRSGPTPKRIRDTCRPWLFQTAPGSYQFAVAIEKPKQEELFAEYEIRPDALTDTFMSILKAATEDPDGSLVEIVPQEDYRKTFLKMTRNLAPMGKSFEELEIKSTYDDKRISLSPESRRNIGESLKRKSGTTVSSVVDEEIEIKGVLRALDLDNDWLEISTDGSTRRVLRIGEAVDDLIGPMVNKEVTVRVKPGPRNTNYFIDIEQEE